jgi:hypothetical protein
MAGEYDDQGNYIPPPDNSVYRTGNRHVVIYFNLDRLIDDSPSAPVMFFGNIPIFMNDRGMEYGG